jgi:ADP-ribosylglycohydrolase
MTDDRIRGMFLGGALGDALGAPHEFRTSKNIYIKKIILYY